MRQLALVGLMLLLALVVTGVRTPVTAALAPEARYPDLKTQIPSDSLHIIRITDPALRNGVPTWVLQFGNMIWNDGEGALQLRPETNGSVTTVHQEVFTTQQASGLPVVSRVVGTADFHVEHDHWHINDFTLYELYTRADWDRKTGNALGRGTKTSFCVIDTHHIKGRRFPPAYTACGATSLYGITVGWGDLYSPVVFGQWVVLGDIPLADGQYVLRSVADPLNKIHESPNGNDSRREQNNEAVFPFSVCFGDPIPRNRC